MRVLNLILILSVSAELCPDYEIGTKCVSQCDSVKSACHIACEDDPICDYNCAVALNKCINECPCFSECEQGCDGCDNGMCTCAYPDDNPDHVACAEHVYFVYAMCLGRCTSGDVHCLSVCGYEFADDLETCPCNVWILKLFSNVYFFSGRLPRRMSVPRLGRMPRFIVA